MSSSYFYETVEISSLFFLVPSSVRWSNYLGNILGTLCPAPTVSPSSFLFFFQVCFNLWGLKRILNTSDQGLSNAMTEKAVKQGRESEVWNWVQRKGEREDTKKIHEHSDLERTSLTSGISLGFCSYTP